MELTEIKEKYNKAHEAYLKYKDTNGTNNIEAAYLPEIIEALKRDFYIVPDCLLNFLGCDLIDLKSGQLYDVKICQYLHGTEVLIDCWKHDKKGNWYKATDVKINDAFIFLNHDNIIIITTKYIENRIPPKEDCFYMKRDIYRTTLKAVIDVSDCRKLVIPRQHN